MFINILYSLNKSGVPRWYYRESLQEMWFVGEDVLVYDECFTVCKQFLRYTVGFSQQNVFTWIDDDVLTTRFRTTFPAHVRRRLAWQSDDAAGMIRWCAAKPASSTPASPLSFCCIIRYQWNNRLYHPLKVLKSPTQFAFSAHNRRYMCVKPCSEVLCCIRIPSTPLKFASWQFLIWMC